TIPLPPRTFDTLVALVERKGHLIEKNDLLETVWHGDFVEEVNLTVHISALRKALGKLEDGSGFIETVPKRGYRFVVPVRELDATNEIEISRRVRVQAVEEEIETDDGTAESRSSASRRGPRPIVVAGIALAAIALVALSVLTYNAFRSARDFSKYNWKP